MEQSREGRHVVGRIVAGASLIYHKFEAMRHGECLLCSLTYLIGDANGMCLDCNLGWTRWVWGSDPIPAQTVDTGCLTFCIAVL